LIVDESHHFPEDKNDEMKIFGKVCDIARKYFVVNGKRVLLMTATHGRMDGKIPFGIERDKLDYRRTVQQSVDEGYTPPIYGIQVFLDLECSSVKRNDLVWLKFDTEADRQVYLDTIVDCMVKVWKKKPKPTCVFAQSVKDAREIAKKFNKKSGLGEKGLGVLVGDTQKNSRFSLLDDIESGKRLGYVTCNVGGESINIKSLEVIHLVRRTRSWNRLMQAPGRGMRNYCRGRYKKKDVLIVDYGMMKANIVNGCLGLMAFAQASGSRIKNPVVAGPLVFSKKSKAKYATFKVKGLPKIGDVESWISKQEEWTGYKESKEIMRRMSFKTVREYRTWLRKFNDGDVEATERHEKVLKAIGKKMGRNQ
jgi:hypothetical protein